MTHLGRDFSSYQGNLTPADCAGIDFAYCKATEGGSYKNPNAVQQVQMLRSQGVAVGLYHFYDPTDSIGGQLGNLAAYAHALGDVALPIALDSETTDPVGWQDLANKMVQFAMAVENWNHVVPNQTSIFYVNETFYNNLPGFPWGRGVWYARPGVSEPDKPCLVWQSGQRPVAGQSIDTDQFMGTEAQWAVFTGGSAPVTINPDPVTVDTTKLDTVPGTGLPGTPQLVILGQMQNATGLYRGLNVIDERPVFAGLGNPTTWTTDYNPRTLPAGTSLATYLDNIEFVTTTELTEQF